MIIAFIASFFEYEIFWVTVMLRQLQRMIWVKWGLKLFPFIMIHVDDRNNNAEKEMYAVTFTYDKFWEQRFQKYLESENDRDLTKEIQN